MLHVLLYRVFPGELTSLFKLTQFGTGLNIRVSESVLQMCVVRNDIRPLPPTFRYLSSWWLPSWPQSTASACGTAVLSRVKERRSFCWVEPQSFRSVAGWQMPYGTICLEQLLAGRGYTYTHSTGCHSIIAGCPSGEILVAWLAKYISKRVQTLHYLWMFWPLVVVVALLAGSGPSWRACDINNTFKVEWCGVMSGRYGDRKRCGNHSTALDKMLKIVMEKPWWSPMIYKQEILVVFQN